jgi:peptide/nickel transport system substrate-binding protein
MPSGCLPYLDELVIQIVPDAGTGVLAFERGEIDVLTSTPGADVVRLQASGAATVRAAGFGPDNPNCQETMFFNLRQPNLPEVEVRQASAYAIGWAYNPNVTRYTRDVAKANELLDQAGFPRGAGGTRFSIGMPFRADLGRMHEIIRENLSDVGIIVNIKSFELNAAIDTIFIKREFDVGVWGYCNGPDPEVGVTRAYVTSNIKPIPFANVAEYSNPWTTSSSRRPRPPSNGTSAPSCTATSRTS